MATRAKTGGRQKGTPNKISRTIRDAVLSSFELVGGERYLLRQAEENPVAYMSLLAKILPTQITGADDGPVACQWLPPNES